MRIGQFGIPKPGTFLVVMLLSEYLDYQPPVIKSAPEGHREVAVVTAPRHPRLDDVTVELWHDFVPQTIVYIDALRETAGTTVMEFHFSRRTRRSFQNVI